MTLIKAGYHCKTCRCELWVWKGYVSSSTGYVDPRPAWERELDKSLQAIKKWLKESEGSE